MQDEGDFDGWTAARAAIDAFRNDPRLPDAADAAATTPEIALIREKYRQQAAERAYERSKRVLFLSGRYADHLRARQKEATVAGRFDEAQRIDAELERVRGSELVSAAQFVVADRAAAATAATHEVPATNAAPGAGAEPPGETKRAAGSAEEPAATDLAALPEDPRIYAGVAPPALPAGRQRVLTMTPVARTPYKGRLAVAAVLSVDPRVDTAAASDADSAFELIRRATLHRLRVALRTTSRHYALADPVVAVQYFARAERAPSRESAPEEAASEFIRLPSLRADWLTVDLPPVVLAGTSLSYRSDGYKRSQAVAREFFGVVVTVFASNGELLYQAVSDAAMKDLGTKALPGRPSD
jgi:hypothetical protein